MSEEKFSSKEGFLEKYPEYLTNEELLELLTEKQKKIIELHKQIDDALDHLRFIHKNLTKEDGLYLAKTYLLCITRAEAALTRGEK